MRLRLHALVFAAVGLLTPIKALGTEPASARSPSATLGQRAVALLQQTAEALRSRSIEPDEQPAFLDLIAVAEQLKNDQTQSVAENERLRGLIRGRLQQAQQVLKRHSSRVPVSLANRTTILAQQFPGGPQFAAPQFGVGGPQVGGAQQQADELIDIITATIDPGSWEQAGGRGVIRYWPMGHALVIRATAAEHENVADLIGQLRQ